MSRMLRSVTGRNHFYNLAYFPHCSHTQQIRELFKLKWPRSIFQGSVKTSWAIWRPAEVRPAEAGPAQRMWSPIFSHVSVTQSAAGKGSLLHQPRMKVLKRPLQKQNKKHRRPQVSCTLPIRWWCCMSDPEPLQGDASSSSLSTQLSAWISGWSLKQVSPRTSSCRTQMKKL